MSAPVCPVFLLDDATFRMLASFITSTASGAGYCGLPRAVAHIRQGSVTIRVVGSSDPQSMEER